MSERPFCALVRMLKAPSLACKLVLLTLATYADPETGEAFPSVGTLADDCGMSRRAVQVALRRLEAVGLIEPIGRRTGGRADGNRGAPTRYRIVFSKGASDDARAHLTTSKGASDDIKGASDDIQGRTTCARRVREESYEEPTKRARGRARGGRRKQRFPDVDF